MAGRLPRVISSSAEDSFAFPASGGGGADFEEDSSFGGEELIVA